MSRVWLQNLDTCLKGQNLPSFLGSLMLGYLGITSQASSHRQDDITFLGLGILIDLHLWLASWVGGVDHMDISNCFCDFCWSRFDREMENHFPYTSKHLLGSCYPHSFLGSKHLLTRYLEDLGCLEFSFYHLLVGIYSCRTSRPLNAE